MACLVVVVTRRSVFWWPATRPFVVRAVVRVCHDQTHTGRQDPAVGYRDAWQIIENYPRASYIVLDRSEHGTTPQHTELFKILVGDWLDRVEEAETS